MVPRAEDPAAHALRVEQSIASCPECTRPGAGGGLRTCSRFVAVSPKMRELLATADPAARGGAPVILVGETGTGKEILARAIHVASGRSGPFVAVNCGALPGELVESELFGHVRGAFSGALADRRGLLEEADGGTLLLDELGELPLPAQVKLLRLLQDGEVRPVGSSRARHVDVRFVAATNRELHQAIAAGRFRADLYYRLAVFEMRVPPLRERREDVLPLARLFLEAEGRPLRLSAEAEGAFLAHRWPGNLREMCNVVRRAAAMAAGDVVGIEHLPPGFGSAARPADPSALRPLAEIEREHILSVLRACGGCQLEAARVLGIGRTTLWRKLASYGAAPPDGTGGAEG